MNLGAAQGPVAGEITVDQSAECWRADLSLPRSVGSFMARVFLDSGSALTSIRWIVVADVIEFWRRWAADSA